MCKIYKITNKINQKIYIGKTTKTLEHRFKFHIYSMKYTKTHLAKAMLKYGEENFKIDLIEETNIDAIDEREKFWIKELSPHYNLTKGGDGGDTSKSQNYINAMREHHKNRTRETYASYGMLGKSQSSKFLEAIKKSNSCPIMCEGIQYNSVGEAEQAYKNMGIPISIRKRLDSDKHPDFYRLKDKIKRK